MFVSKKSKQNQILNLVGGVDYFNKIKHKIKQQKQQKLQMPMVKLAN